MCDKPFVACTCDWSWVALRICVEFMLVLHIDLCPVRKGAQESTTFGDIELCVENHVDKTESLPYINYWTEHSSAEVQGAAVMTYMYPALL